MRITETETMNDKPHITSAAMWIAIAISICAVVDLCRMHGISDATFYNWSTKYSGMEVPDAKRLKVLEDENKKLKQMLVDSMLENKAIKDVLSK